MHAKQSFCCEGRCEFCSALSMLKIRRDFCYDEILNKLFSKNCGTSLFVLAPSNEMVCVVGELGHFALTCIAHCIMRC